MLRAALNQFFNIYLDYKTAKLVDLRDRSPDNWNINYMEKELREINLIK